MERWFDTGLKMQDGKTTISVRAESESRAEEYLKKGWKPLRVVHARKKNTKGEKDEGREQGG
jgi:hypothetical protein